MGNSISANVEITCNYEFILEEDRDNSANGKVVGNSGVILEENRDNTSSLLKAIAGELIMIKNKRAMNKIFLDTIFMCINVRL
ncbi:MAG TPA: hypothetical protein VMW63_10130 [Methanoregulaceae archaeon]|nr:hypothetical protein [Methanoregulaceae archaeon]